MRAACLLLVSLALALPARAAVPARPSGNVSDFAGALGAASEAAIEASIQSLAGRDVKLAVAVIASASPQQPKEWAVEAFNTWGVGEKGKDNGVLVLLAVQDRRVEIETGYGVEARLTDSQAGRLLDTHAVPYFRRNDWAGGLVALCQGIDEHLGGARRAAPRARPPMHVAPRRPSDGGGGSFLVVVGMALLFLLNPFHASVVFAGIWMLWALSLPMRHLFMDRKFAIFGLMTCIWVFLFPIVSPAAAEQVGPAIIMLLLGLIFGLYTLSRACPRCKVGYTNVWSRTIRSATYYSSGTGETTTTCPQCGYHDVSTYHIPRRTQSTSSSSSGWSSGSSSRSSWSSGSSSYGGGSSGGGGAGRSF